MSDPLSPANILTLGRGFMGSKVLLVAAKLHLFDMLGFGAVEIEHDEPVFHERWEARAYALNVRGLTVLRAYKVHEYRHSDHFIPEIVDPESGEWMPRGEIGELVLTAPTTS